MEHGYASCDYSCPANALKLGHQHDSGEYVLAVAKTDWGKIPAKANLNGNCWYGYYGNEHGAGEFEYVTFPCSITTTPNTGDGPPPGARPLGFQTDGRGDQYAVIANTEWGKIPGKACDNTCWYPYGGAEHETTDFEYVTCMKAAEGENMCVELKKDDSPPDCALKFGHQTDGAGDLWVGVAETEWGQIPCKAGWGEAWYCYGGSEYSTDDFHYVIHTSPHKFVANDGSGAPEGAIVTGHQTDGRGDQYAAIANSEHGRIPGKACDNTCWYPFGGIEHETTDFDYVVFSCDH